MKSAHRLSVIVAAFALSVSPTHGQQGPDQSLVAGKIANWPTQPYWNPRARPVSVRQGEGGVRMEGVEALPTSPLPFIGIAPCRILDTRGNGAPIQGGIFADGEARDYTLPSTCGIPATAQAVSLNVTVTGAPSAPPGAFLLAFPQGGVVPPVSILNYQAGQTIANAATVPLGSGGGITVNVSHSTHVIIDTNGYYAPAGIGIGNTFLGLNAGNFTMTGNFNTGFGQSVLASNATGGGNTATGIAALVGNTTGNDNTATGSVALLNNTTGNENTATGAFALSENSMGSGNTATGFFALSFNSTGVGNTADGRGALEISTGSNNIGIGSEAGSNLTTGNNNICIGNSGVAGESNAIRIGTVGTHMATFLAGINGTGVTGVPVLVSNSGQLGVAPSSRDVKEDIREIAHESDGLMRLRPVAFKYTTQIDPTGLAQYGLIAEEVADVYPDLVAYDRDGRPETVRYHLVNALLLNEVQKQHRIAEAQKMTIEREKAEIEELKARLSRLEARVPAD
ncbi:MAG TPA: tail fiber domain-containing protein [Thermoanaerobaculia bacterium]|nr:tail fiber domain-containing protein [Thermoanaerobaculia bacterium]